jgi:hypothetical protein
MLSRIVIRTGRMSADILKKSFVHFKQLRSLELSDAVFMSDFTLWEVLGTLPSLANFDLRAFDPASHPAHATENSNSQSGGPKYFEALESLCVTGSFFLIQHLLDFIDSPCLTTIKVYPVINHVVNEYDHEPDNPFTPSMTIIASKWSQSLKNLVIYSSPSDTVRVTAQRYTVSKYMMLLLMVLHEMQTFRLFWKMENMDDDVRRLVMSWPKLRTLSLPLADTFISLSTLRIIAENCPELRYLEIPLNTSTIPPFDTCSKSLHHNLEVLVVEKARRSTTQTSLECQIQVTQHLDFIFPYLKSIEVCWPHIYHGATCHPCLESIEECWPHMNHDATWSGIRDLVKLCQNARRVIK